jgi:hypothetical protein
VQKKGVIDAEILLLYYLIPEGQYSTGRCARSAEQFNANVSDGTTMLLATGIPKG